MKNILAENMLRFGVKNLNETNKTNLLILTEAPITAPSGGAQPIQDDQKLQDDITIKLRQAAELQRQADIYLKGIDALNADIEYQKNKEEIEQLNAENKKILGMIAGDPTLVRRKLSRKQIRQLQDQMKINQARLLELRGSQIKIDTTPSGEKRAANTQQWIKYSLEVVLLVLGALKTFLMIRSEFKGDPVRTPAGTGDVGATGSDAAGGSVA